jgi:hypothetical protein
LITLYREEIEDDVWRRGRRKISRKARIKKTCRHKKILKNRISVEVKGKMRRRMRKKRSR